MYTLNDDIVFIEPADEIVRSIPFTITIWFNKSVTNYSVTTKVDEKTINPDLITLTPETQELYWKYNKGVTGLQNFTQTYYKLSFDHYFGTRTIASDGTITDTGESMAQFTLTYDTDTEEDKTFTFVLYQQIGDYFN